MSCQDSRDCQEARGGTICRAVVCRECSPGRRLGFTDSSAVSTDLQNPVKWCFQAGSFKVTYSLPTSLILGRWSQVCSKEGSLCSHPGALRGSAPHLLLGRGETPFALELGWKKLLPACRQLGYLCVYIIWAVCDCRAPLFYLIVCLEASPDLIMPAVVSLNLSRAPSGIAWAGSSVHTLSWSWANRAWQGVSGFLRLRSLLGCY